MLELRRDGFFVFCHQGEKLRVGDVGEPAERVDALAVLRGETATAPVTQTRTNLPAEVTSFVGREPEIERIAALLERGRLVTLVGPGGAGKTRLAREAVARWVDRVRDGVWLVELAPVTDSMLVVGLSYPRARLAPRLLLPLHVRAERHART